MSSTFFFPVCNTNHSEMAVFSAKVFRTKAQQAAYDKTLTGRYEKGMRTKPFLYFGLPFMTFMAIGSVLLSNFTAVRYERNDRKVREVTDDEKLKISKNKRRVDVREEFYKLQHMAEEDWEPKRVPRMKGESDNVF